MSHRKQVSMLANPIGALNEYAQRESKPSPSYILVEEKGEPHCKSFTIKCSFLSFEALGRDKTKQEAKKSSALEMLNLLKSKKYNVFADMVEPTPSVTTVRAHQTACVAVQLQPTETHIVSTSTTLDDIINPIGWLQEYCQRNGLNRPAYDCVTLQSPFKCRCIVEKYTVSGIGYQKQIAKSNAATIMCHLIRSKGVIQRDLTTDMNGGGPAVAENSVLRTSTLQNDLDEVDTDILNRVSPTNKSSIIFLSEVNVMANIPQPEYILKGQDATNRFICICKIIIFETCGRGRTSQVAKVNAADRMMDLLCSNVNLQDVNNNDHEKRFKVKEYLRRVYCTQYGVSEENKEDVIKKWLEIRKQFPFAKMKVKKPKDFTTQHTYIRSLNGDCINALKNSSIEKLELKGMDFLAKLAKEQNFKIKVLYMSSHDVRDTLTIIRIDHGDYSFAFSGYGKSESEALQNVIKGTIKNLMILAF